MLLPDTVLPDALTLPYKDKIVAILFGSDEDQESFENVIWPGK